MSDDLAICPFCQAGVPFDDWAPSCDHQIVDYTSEYDGILGDSRCGNAPLDGLNDLHEAMKKVVEIAWRPLYDPEVDDPPLASDSELARLEAAIRPLLPDWGLKEILECARMGELPGPLTMASIESHIDSECAIHIRAAIVGEMTAACGHFGSLKRHWKRRPVFAM